MSVCVCYSKAGHPAPSILSEFLLFSWSTRFFHPYSGLLHLILHHNSSWLLLLLMVLLLPLLSSFLSFAYPLLLSNCPSQDSMLVLPENLPALPYSHYFSHPVTHVYTFRSFHPSTGRAVLWESTFQSP